MDYYLLGLKALSFLFDKTGVDYWNEYINIDIAEWLDNSSVSHHLQAYGAMGSINDVVICEQNNHNIKSNEEAWANTILQRLLLWCNHLAHCIEEGGTPSKAVLDEIDVYKDNQIQGCRCLHCGYAELNERNIDAFIAPSIVDVRFNEATNENEIYECIASLLYVNDPLIKSEREKMIKAIAKSDINYVFREGFMRPCPNCNSDDTAVYRWDVKRRTLTNAPSKLVAAQNNLPLRK